MRYLRENKAKVDSFYQSLGHEIALPKAEAVIVFPSLCMPNIIRNHNSAILILLANKALADSKDILLEPNVSLLQKRINLQLRYSRFDINKTFGKCFSSYPKVLDFGAVPKNESLYLKEDSCNFQVIISEETISFYYKEDYKFYIIISQSLDINHGVLEVDWYSINNTSDQPSLYIKEDDLIRRFLGQNNSNTTSWGCEDTKDIGPAEIFSRHLIFLLEKDVVNVAHMTDLHISSRQLVLEKNPISDITKSQPSTKVNTSVDNVWNLLQVFGHNDSVDIIWITGDIIDFHINIDLESISVSTTTDAWNSLDINNYSNNKIYKAFVDMNTFYSLVIKFYISFKKPIFFVSGNHDAYESPYGISPRLFDSNLMFRKGIKANATIPMDHNLTFYEAILLFGPGFAKITKKHYLQEYNYQKKYNIYSTLILSPITDIGFKLGEQYFIGLCWGDDEVVVEPILKMSGQLPRANKAMSKYQKKMIYEWLCIEKSNNSTFFFLHAPLINYDYSVPSCAQVSLSEQYCSKYDSGSFKYGRSWLIRKALDMHGKALFFSGHSHRSVLYTLAKVEGDFWVRAREFCNVLLGKVSFIVSGSSGPISTVNKKNEYGGYGLERPNASYIEYKQDDILLKKVFSNKKNAIPRACVLVDSFDALSSGGFFSQFYGLGDIPSFMRIQINRKFFNGNVDIISKMQLYVLYKDKMSLKHVYELYVTYLGNGEYRLDNSSVMVLLKNRQYNLFLSTLFVKFDDNYNYTDPWILKISISELYDYKENIYKTSNMVGFKVERDPVYGEIPDFKWHCQDM